MKNEDVFVEYMYVSDLKEILSKTDAVFGSKELQEKFFKYETDILLKTKYTVNSPITYIEIESAEEILL
jgi:hypothetical protein